MAAAATSIAWDEVYTEDALLAAVTRLPSEGVVRIVADAIESQGGTAGARKGKGQRGAKAAGSYAYVELDDTWHAAWPSMLKAFTRVFGFESRLPKDVALLARKAGDALPGMSARAPVYNDQPLNALGSLARERLAAPSSIWPSDAKRQLERGASKSTCGFYAAPSPCGLHISVNASDRGTVAGRRVRFRAVGLLSYGNDKIGRPSDFDERLFHARWLAVQVETEKDPADGLPQLVSARSPHITVACFGAVLDNGVADAVAALGGGFTSATPLASDANSSSVAGAGAGAGVGAGVGARSVASKGVRARTTAASGTGGRAARRAVNGTAGGRGATGSGSGNGSGKGGVLSPVRGDRGRAVGTGGIVLAKRGQPLGAASGRGRGWAVQPPQPPPMSPTTSTHAAGTVSGRQDEERRRTRAQGRRHDGTTDAQSGVDSGARAGASWAAVASRPQPTAAEIAAMADSQRGVDTSGGGDVVGGGGKKKKKGKTPKKATRPAPTGPVSFASLIENVAFDSYNGAGGSGASGRGKPWGSGARTQQGRRGGATGAGTDAGAGADPTSRSGSDRPGRSIAAANNPRPAKPLTPAEASVERLREFKRRTHEANRVEHEKKAKAAQAKARSGGGGRKKRLTNLKKIVLRERIQRWMESMKAVEAEKLEDEARVAAEANALPATRDAQLLRLDDEGVVDADAAAAVATVAALVEVDESAAAAAAGVSPEEAQRGAGDDMAAASDDYPTPAESARHEVSTSADASGNGSSASANASTNSARASARASTNARTHTSDSGGRANAASTNASGKRSGGANGSDSHSGSGKAEGAASSSALAAAPSTTPGASGDTGKDEEAAKILSGDFVVTYATRAADITRVVPKVVTAADGVRQYVDQVMSADLDTAVVQLVSTLYYYQERMRSQNPTKAKMRRRMVLGLREVDRNVRSGKIKLLVVAPNIDEGGAAGGMDDRINSIIATARAQEVPIAFALTRRRLGKALCKNLRVSVVGILSFDGADGSQRRVIDLAEKQRAEWHAAHPLSPRAASGGPTEDDAGCATRLSASGGADESKAADA